MGREGEPNVDERRVRVDEVEVVFTPVEDRLDRLEEPFTGIEEAFALSKTASTGANPSSTPSRLTSRRRGQPLRRRANRSAEQFVTTGNRS
jgi:hypothetical protein